MHQSHSSPPNTVAGVPSLPIEVIRPTITWQISDFVGVTEAQRARIIELLDIARTRRELSAAPTWSKYPVGASACFGEGRTAQGSNYEYGGAAHGTGGTRAVHSEEAVIADGKQRFGSAALAEIVTFNTVSPEPAFSCGNCIDAVRAHSHPNVLIVGSVSSGVAHIRTMADIFPESFKQISRDELTGDLIDALEETARVSQYGNQIFSIPSRGVSSALVMTDNGGKFFGAPFDTASFHGRSAIEVALGSAWTKGEKEVQAIILITEGSYVSGIERQFIFETADMLKRTDTLPVIIANPDLTRIQRTTPRGLFPFGFGPRSIGILKD